MFNHITQNWRGRPLTSHKVIVNLIANTTTGAGITVSAALGKGTYPTGTRVSDDEFATVNLHRDDFQGDWNYSVLPHKQESS
ncbi:MAG: hypothetical protein M0031_01020 [Thermaerobacter sp.]|jgi:hypothetical protein|nr:hypothetical protein [Thermaerobacter sp.]